MRNLATAFANIAHPRILVIGDIILDRYVWGDAERVSPEAPVLVLRSDRQEARLGGAASVAALLRGLKAEVVLAGVVGGDDSGRRVRELLDADQIGSSAVLTATGRPTTTKERFIGRTASRATPGGNQILRVDYEVREPISSELESHLANAALSLLPNCQTLLVSDYHKGVCTPRMLAQLVSAARDLGIPILVDPARTDDYCRYAGATVVVPNRVEAEWGTGRKIRTPDDACTAAYELLAMCQAEAVVLKLDRDGMVIAQRDGAPLVLPTRPRDVCDVTGAGDMVLATLGLCYASGIDLPTAAALANAAAGLEVERMGVVAVTRSEICAELGISRRRNSAKLATVDQIVELAACYRRQGKSIVFTNGCFDLLHVGHVNCLREAAHEGDVLVVAVNSDASVRRLKGPLRPVVSEENRTTLLSALACVDHVVLFDDDTPHSLLRQIRPDVLVKGGTYCVEDVVGREVVEEYGGRVCVVGCVEGISTTGILNSVQQLTGSQE